MNKNDLASKMTKRASKKILNGAKTPEGMSAIGGAVGGGGFFVPTCQSSGGRLSQNVTSEFAARHTF